MTKKVKPKKSANKAKHSKLMNQKISKIKLKKINKRERLKEIIKKVNNDKISRFIRRANELSQQTQITANKPARSFT